MGLHISTIPPALKDTWDLKDSKTVAMVYATQFIEWGQITEEDHVRWFARVSAYEKLTGPILHTAGGEAIYLTLDDVKQYIGLWTNVPYLPDVQFAQKLYGMLQDIIRAELREAGVDVKAVFDQKNDKDVEKVFTVVTENGTYEDTGNDYLTVTLYTSSGHQFAPREHLSRDLVADGEDWDPDAIESSVLDGIVRIINKL